MAPPPSKPSHCDFKVKGERSPLKVSVADLSSDSDFGEDMLVKIEDEKKANADAKAGKRKRKVVPVTKEEKHREQYRKHQKGKKRRVEQMTVREADRQRRENPLIGLLNVTIELTDSEGGGDTDDDSSSGGDDAKNFRRNSSSSKPSPGKTTEYKPADAMDVDKPGSTTENDSDDGLSVPGPPRPIKVESTVDLDSDDEDDVVRFRRERLAELAAMRAKDTAAQPVASTSKVMIEDLVDTDTSDFDNLDEGRRMLIRDNNEKLRKMHAAQQTTPAQSAASAAAPSQPKASHHVPKDARPFFRMQDHSKMVQEPLELGKDAKTGQRIEVPASINRYLREYQRDGIRFFYKHYARGEGGILGDDMGLGKTIQVIGFLAAIMGRRGGRATDDGRRAKAIRNNKTFEKATDRGPTCLLVVPASVIYNWARELETWGYFEYEVFRGVDKERKGIAKRFAKGFYDILICGLDTARGHASDLNHLDFTTVIIDECHRVKNPRAATTIAMHSFETKIRFGLTGTAMQNRYGEMWTILDWAFPRRLGSAADWKAWVEVPISKAQKHNSSTADLAIGRERAIALVTNLLPNFFLRRTKELIADQLPKKIDKTVFCPLSEQQMDAYRRLLACEDVQLIVTHDEPCPCGTVDDNGAPFQKGKCCFEGWASLIFKYMTLFQKLANHACLIYPDLQSDPSKFDSDTRFTQLAFPIDHRNRVAGFAAEQDKSLCGKWAVLGDLLRTWHKDKDKVLIFSRSRRLLNAIQHWMDEDYPDQYCRLDGTTPTEKRLPLCDEFNNDDKVFAFLISTLAGGVGLNLTAANKVVIFDPNWNPSHDAQAQDRAYRWGQLRDVEVFRLIGAGSLEELIYTRQIYKQQQNQIAYKATAERRYFSGVQGDSKDKGELFGVKNIFRLRDGPHLVKPLIDQCNVAELGYALSHLADDHKKGKKDEGDGDDAPGDENVEDLITKLVKNPEEGLKALQAPKTTEIDEILLRNGISYTHHNDRVVGESAIELAVSNNAMKLHAESRSRKNARLGAGSAYTAPKIGGPKVKLESVNGAAVWPPPRPKKQAPTDASAVAFQPRDLRPQAQQLQGLVDQMGGSEVTIEELVESAGFANPTALMENLFSHKVDEQEALLQRYIKKAISDKRAAAAQKRAEQ